MTATTTYHDGGVHHSEEEGLVKRLQAALFAILFCTQSHAGSLSENGCVSKTDNVVGWEPPPEGIVRNEHDAVKIAQVAWSSVNPKAKEISEVQWDRSMTALLADHVWRVSKKQHVDTIGGDVIISISQCDGRILGILLTQ